MMPFFASFLYDLTPFIKKWNRFRGDGNLYVLLVIGSVMAGAFALTGGILPTLEQNPPASKQVEIDEASARRSSEDALQLVDLKIKPSPTPTPTVLPPTPTVACLNQTVVTLIIDLSASMGNDGKIGALNNAMNAFVGSLNNNTVIGGVAFGGETLRYGSTEGVANMLSYTVYGTNQSTVKNTLTGLTAGPLGGTFMRNGFQVALSRLRAVKSSYPGYRHIAIIFSDGVPEMFDYRNPTCLVQEGTYGGDGFVCFAREQDPRSTPYGLTGTDYTAQLKSEVDKVYSLAIYNSTPGTRGATMTPNLIQLLKTIASGTSSPYYQAVDLRSGSVGNLTSFFRTIVNDSCI